MPNFSTNFTLLPSTPHQVPEYLSRVSVKMGMAGYVHNMGHAVRAFVRERRSRGLLPNQHDPNR